MEGWLVCRLACSAVTKTEPKSLTVGVGAGATAARYDSALLHCIPVGVEKRARSELLRPDDRLHLAVTELLKDLGAQLGR